MEHGIITTNAMRLGMGTVDGSPPRHGPDAHSRSRMGLVINTSSTSNIEDYASTMTGLGQGIGVRPSASPPVFCPVRQSVRGINIIVYLLVRAQFYRVRSTGRGTKKNRR